MADNTFIVLCTFEHESLSKMLEEKAQNIVTSAKRAAEMAGVTIVDMYFTAGDFDMAIVCTAPDNKTALTFLPVYSNVGGVHTLSLAASSAEEVLASAQDAHTKMLQNP